MLPTCTKTIACTSRYSEKVISLRLANLFSFTHNSVDAPVSMPYGNSPELSASMLVYVYCCYGTGKQCTSWSSTRYEEPNPGIFERHCHDGELHCSLLAPIPCHAQIYLRSQQQSRPHVQDHTDVVLREEKSCRHLSRAHHGAKIRKVPRITTEGPSPYMVL